MKSQSQLQQQAAAAALVKKSGNHGAANSRRLRRNVDVVVNAMKSQNQQRSNSSNNIPLQNTNTSNKPNNRSTLNQGVNPIGVPGGVSNQDKANNFHQVHPNMHLFHRKQMMNSSGVVNAGASHHSHSQQVLDNSQAIQQKISMYQNQSNARKQSALNMQHSPINVVKGKTGSNGSAKIVPAQLQRTFLQNRQNQTPNPTTNPQLPIGGLGQQNSTNIQQQLQHMIGKRQVPHTNDRSSSQQHLQGGGSTNPVGAGTNNLSSYYDIGLPNNKHHANSAQNLEIIQRASSQLQVNPATKQQLLGGVGQGNPMMIQIKGQKQSNRNMAYGGTLTNRQKSSKQQIAHTNTLYSQISLKEMQSPVKQPKMASKVNLQKMQGNGSLYGQSSQRNIKATSGLDFVTKPGKKSLNNGHNTKSNAGAQQTYVQYGGGQSHNQPHHASSLEEYVPDLDQIQQLMDNMGVEEQQRTRNLSNVVTTNGLTTQNSHNQSAILNINTASDINIYNNSFIVRASPTQLQQQQQQVQQQSKAQGSVKQAGTNSRHGHSVKRQTKNNSNSNAVSSYTQRNVANLNKVGTGKNQNNLPANSQRDTAGLLGVTPGANTSIRSMSTGRNQKSAHGSRNGATQKLASMPQSKASRRAQAITEAYNSNKILVNNNTQIAAAPLQTATQAGHILNMQVTPNQLKAGRDGPGNFPRTNPRHQEQANGVYQQAAPNRSKQNGAGVKSYNSTENIKRSDDSQLGTNTAFQENKRANGSLNRPQYNNLVQDSQQRLGFPQESGIQINNKRNFKNVKKNRLAFQTQPVGDHIRSSDEKNLAQVNVFKKQHQQVLTRSADLINRGRQKIKTKDFNEAIKLFTEVLDNVEPNNLDAVFFRAISYLDQGNLQQAINELWRLVESKGSQDEHEKELCQQAYILLSIAHKRLGEMQNATQDLDQCIEAFPAYSDAYLARGQTLLLHEEYGVALKDFEKFIQLNKTSFSGYLGVGDCHKAMKSYKEATQAYTKAISLITTQKLKPNYEQVYIKCYMRRGLSGYHEGSHRQALADLQQVVFKDTSNVKAHFYIGKLLAKGVENDQSKQTDAILHFEQVAKYPDQEFYYGNALFQIAKLRLRQKDYYEAFFCLKRAADNNFTSKRLAMYKDFTEGVLYLIKRKIKKGVQILSDLLEILINKDKDLNSKEEDGKQTLDAKKRQANKVHADYLIHQILLFRAYGYVAIEKYEVAQEDIRRVSKYGKIDAATIYNKWLGKGILRMDHEDYLMASKFFAKAWKKYPGSKDPYCLQVISIVRSYSYSLGGYHIDQQVKYDKVLETKRFMDKAIANCCINQKESSLYFFRGLLNFQMHNFYDALADFNAAIQVEEESSAYFFLARGRTYACLSILTEAMKDLSVALNLDETLQQAYIYRGKCAYLIGDNNLAFLDFQRLILTDPKNPMVHVYAGNLLMTTGAYQDAIKAYENADTVEPTTVSAFQRVRCFCALSDLPSAKILMDSTKKMQPDDLILKFDGLCLDELIQVAKVTQKMTESNLKANDVKTCDSVLSGAITTFDELISSYLSDRLTHLKRRDSILNVQVIPSVSRIRIEKAMVAHDIQNQKEQLPLELSNDLPYLSVDLDEPFNPGNLKHLLPYSYYYENIFNVEDFFLYRGVFKFYQQEYEQALVDFDRAFKAYKECQGQPGEDPSLQSRGFSGLNSRNPTLQHYTMGNGGEGNTLVSNATDLSDVGMSSFNELEITYNIFLCYLYLNDKTNALHKLNELQRKTPKKYAQQIPLLRAITLEQFQEGTKAKAELQKLKKVDQALYDSVFNTKAKPFQLGLFPQENRLCQQFAPIPLKLNTNSGAFTNVSLLVKLSFSMPFIKPPNMIPNVDEEIVQSEFNLKQIDAPMPEAPWIKRCEHGINFTNHITQEGRDAVKYKKFFEDKKGKGSKAQNSKKNSAKDKVVPNQQLDHNSTNNAGSPDEFSMRTRLLNNIAEFTISDRHKISLMDDDSASPRLETEEENCNVDKCRANQSYELQLLQQQAEDERSDQVNVDDQSSESYDSEEMEQKNATRALALRESGGLIEPLGDSMVNMGENLTRDNIREIKKMKREMVEPNLGGVAKNPNELLPKFEESKGGLGFESGQKAAKQRYAAFDDGDEEVAIGSGILPDSQIQSTTQKMNLTASQQLVQATEAEPHGLNEKMLVGNSQMRRQRERRVSNLSIGVSLTPQAALKESSTVSAAMATRTNAPQKNGKKDKQHQGANLNKGSLFRTSIDHNGEDST